MERSEIPEHLTEADVDAFTVNRSKKGKSFEYTTTSGKNLDEKCLKLVQSYGVPNTWTDVTLCANGNSHILAKGYDGSDKLQYLYHPDYLEYRNSLKFLELGSFGLVLPKIRRKINKHLKHEEWTEQKLVALITKVLDKHYLRIGSTAYAKKNNSFGLTTLRKKHLHKHEHGLSFEYVGKSHQKRTITLEDKELVEHIKECADFPGWEIFSVKTGSQKIKADASMVNDYIREISGESYSAKTFRTWGGSTLAVKLLPKAKQVLEKNKRKELEPTLVQLVAERLGNTPSICKEYYIHPKILASVVKPDFSIEPEKKGKFSKQYLNKSEQRTLEILNPVKNN